MINPNNSLYDIDFTNKADIEAIVDLHLSLLNWGPLARMGRLFLREICYDLMIKDNLMRAAMMKIDDTPAGFIVYTKDSLNFYSRAISNHFVYMSFIMLISFIRNPVILVRTIKSIWLIISRWHEKKMGQEYSAEIIAIGVKQEYRDHRFIRQTGLRISHELILHAVDYFKSYGFKKMRLVVDAFNKEALFFYVSLGGTFETFKRHGEPMYQIWFDLKNIHAKQ